MLEDAAEQKREPEKGSKKGSKKGWKKGKPPWGRKVNSVAQLNYVVLSPEISSGTIHVIKREESIYISHTIFWMQLLYFSGGWEPCLFGPRRERTATAPSGGGQQRAGTGTHELPKSYGALM
ncbi:hypothetical protein DFH09DRAFT_1090913 [Mycena vulgaris]|nr:hypothetical protein DFH09DRAFT_1090913 [Mycena vulgaris]